VEIWAVISQKGGSGKTSLAIHLGIAATQAGKTVVIVDADPQKNALRWAAVRGAEKPPLVMGAIVSELETILFNALFNKADIVIIDSSPRADRDSLEIARKATVLIVPARPSILDIPSAEDTVNLIRAAGQAENTILVLNAVASRTHEGDEAATFLKDALGITPLRLGERADFRHALTNGLGITEYAPKSKAAQELLDLYEEIERITAEATQ
jgi:chromosome partitioning protein